MEEKNVVEVRDSVWVEAVAHWVFDHDFSYPKELEEEYQQATDLVMTKLEFVGRMTKVVNGLYVDFSIYTLPSETVSQKDLFFTCVRQEREKSPFTKEQVFLTTPR